MNFADIPNPSATPAPVTPEAKAPEVKAPVVPEDKAVAEPNKAAESAQPEVKKFKLNIKGKEVEITEEQAIQLMQKASYADQQIKEATQLKKQVESLVTRMKDPKEIRKVLEDPTIGHKVKNLAIEWVKEEMAEEAKDPKDRELEQLRREREEWNKSQEAEKTAKANAEKEEKTKAMAATFRQEIVDAMEAIPGLPKTQATMDRIIGYMRSAYRKNGKVCSAAEAASLASADLDGEVKSRVGSTMDLAKLVEMFGPDVIKKLRDADLAKLKAGNAQDLKGEDKKPAKGPLNKKGRIPEKKFEQYWRENIAGM